MSEQPLVPGGVNFVGVVHHMGKVTTREVDRQRARRLPKEDLPEPTTAPQSFGPGGSTTAYGDLNHSLATKDDAMDLLEKLRLKQAQEKRGNLRRQAHQQAQDPTIASERSWRHRSRP